MDMMDELLFKEKHIGFKCRKRRCQNKLFCYEILPRIIVQLFTILLIQTFNYNISFTKCRQPLKTGYHLICLICEPKIEERQARRGHRRRSSVLQATWKVIESIQLPAVDHLDKLKIISGHIKSQINGLMSMMIYECFPANYLQKCICNSFKFTHSSCSNHFYGDSAHYCIKLFNNAMAP